MKSVFLKTLLITAAFFAAIKIQAMEQGDSYKEPAQLNTQSTDFDVIQSMYDAFSNEINQKFAETPASFFEAIVRLKSITWLMEKSSIATHLGENFKINQENCQITTRETFELPHHMTNSIFKNWFIDAYNKILLEHPKCVEVVNIIVQRIFNNISLNNKRKYILAIESLPKVIKEKVKCMLNKNVIYVSSENSAFDTNLATITYNLAIGNTIKKDRCEADVRPIVNTQKISFIQRIKNFFIMGAAS